MVLLSTFCEYRSHLFRGHFVQRISKHPVQFQIHGVAAGQILLVSLRQVHGAVAARVQEGLEELSHVEGQERQWWEDTPHPRYGAAAVLCWSSHEEIPHA